MTWHELGNWWVEELAGDPAYLEEIEPLVMDLLRPREGSTYLDVGCGEGRLMAALVAMRSRPVGVDVGREVAELASRHGPVVRARLPGLQCFGDASFDGCVVSLVLEHIEEHDTLLAEMARVTAPGGVLALVMNHPLYTAPESAPIEEPDGEVLWRPGRYFERGWTDEPAGEGTVRFHHRPLGDVLTAASAEGWDLQELRESGVSDAQVRRHPPLARQRHIPRILGARFGRRASISEPSGR